MGDVGTFDGCDSCSLTKQARTPFPDNSKTIPENNGDIIVSDVWARFQLCHLEALRIMCRLRTLSQDTAGFTL